MRIEPAVNPNIIGAVKVPDGAIDPFRLTVANVVAARQNGADVLTYHQVIDFEREGNRLTGSEAARHPHRRGAYRTCRPHD